VRTPSPASVLAGRLQLAAKIAVSKIRGRYVFGAAGPYAFDCSGLVRYAYVKAGISGRLGGGHSARAMLLWGQRHHLTSRRNPQVGDVAVWGNGAHVGIYIGGGRVISALNPRVGIKITRVNGLTSAFTTYIHTGH
jgi:cell wall-associated NlpC family hydrolase